jgi:primosomal protein N' (replication factor Y)
VLVQTFSPEHPAIRFAAAHDYPAFAAWEMHQRREFGYPPVARMVRVVVRGESPSQATAVAVELAQRVRQHAAAAGIELRLTGPAPAPVEKLRGKFRFHFLIQFDHIVEIHPVLLSAIEQWKYEGEVQWTVDVDPLDMM